MCWSAGISAELVPRTAPSLTELHEWAATRGIRWLLTLGPANQSCPAAAHGIWWLVMLDPANPSHPLHSAVSVGSRAWRLLAFQYGPCKSILNCACSHPLLGRSRSLTGHLTEQYEWAAARGIRWLVILDPAKLGDGSEAGLGSLRVASGMSSSGSRADSGQQRSSNGSAAPPMVKVRGFRVALENVQQQRRSRFRAAAIKQRLCSTVEGWEAAAAEQIQGSSNQAVALQLANGEAVLSNGSAAPPMVKVSGFGMASRVGGRSGRADSGQQRSSTNSATSPMVKARACGVQCHCITPLNPSPMGMNSVVHLGWDDASGVGASSGRADSGQQQSSNSPAALPIVNVSGFRVKSAPGAGGTKLDELIPLADLTARLAALLFPPGSSPMAMQSLSLGPITSPVSASMAGAVAALGSERTSASGVAQEGGAGAVATLSSERTSAFGVAQEDSPRSMAYGYPQPSYVDLSEARPLLNTTSDTFEVAASATGANQPNVVRRVHLIGFIRAMCK
ncbi:hypothetical protein DUNSADRAFT_2512 [Dunaliella salina]|uniref:Uncharacterized protein n=1 Tax=Dunaliella salina TaxID=3046 RepID=A0ABQ7GVH8_DUNSA|nr:hypothetical protein DUNSADRAFT_2512 [Dunaliella salina]|eukprot:KAF5838603.1 hypothetical protein DUNSADRAFT_2512 [Dunaliella salina]